MSMVTLHFQPDRLFSRRPYNPSASLKTYRKMGTAVFAPGPAGVDGEMGRQFDQFLARYPVIQRAFDLVGKLVGAVEGNQAGNGD